MNFPVEIWREVLGYLDRYTIRTCKPVSRTLLFVATSFYNEDIHIHLDSSNMLEFLNDLENSVFLKTKTSQITIKGTTDPVSFQSILGQCTNLTVLTFDVSTTDTHLKTFSSLDVQLPKIQEIRLSTSEPCCSVALAKLHLLANLKHRDTITAIDILHVGQNAIVQEHGGLDMFITRFPKLCRVKAHSYHRAFVESVYLDKLLYHNRNLQWIELHNMYVDCMESVPQCPYLSAFHLSGANINVSALQCIATNFGTLNNLHLSFQNVVDNDSVPEEQVNAILEHIAAVNMDNVYVRCNYKNRLYSSNNKEAMTA